MPEEQEFSDDEQEISAKRNRQKGSKGKNKNNASVKSPTSSVNSTQHIPSHRQFNSFPNQNLSNYQHPQIGNYNFSVPTSTFRPPPPPTPFPGV